MTGLIEPASSNGQTFFRSDAAISPLNATGRARNVEPVNVIR